MVLPPFCSDAFPGEPVCFPAFATVVVEGGGIVPVSTLAPGDRILSSDGHGSLRFDVVSTFSIAEPNRTGTPFLVITSAAGTTLTLTRAHHLSVGSVCCSTLKRAGDIMIGDVIWQLQDGRASPQVVVYIGDTFGRGLFSPVLVGGGYPIVDGTVTAFDNSAVVSVASVLLPLAEVMAPSLARNAITLVKCAIKTRTGNCGQVTYIDGITIDGPELAMIAPATTLATLALATLVGVSAVARTHK